LSSTQDYCRGCRAAVNSLSLGGICGAQFLS
jgi:hypothetical protein